MKNKKMKSSKTIPKKNFQKLLYETKNVVLLHPQISLAG